MIVAMSGAAKLYEEIIKLRPNWHNDDLKKGVIKVVMTSASSDGPEIKTPYHRSETSLGGEDEDPDDELKLVIVRDMWLTGFDVR